jgi:NAD(P)H-dependent FMN reductase
MPLLQVVVASTRPGRVGLPVATWFAAAARAHGAFEVELVDLLEVGLPFLDEPHHPRLRQYEHDHTRRWSATVERADAFALVMPEYNNGLNAPLKNALDFLFLEWHYKPVGFVSYGGVAAGTRAVQMVKQILPSLKLTPVSAAVAIPSVARHLGDDGRFEPPPEAVRGAAGLLDELVRLEAALRPLRTPG